MTRKHFQDLANTIKEIREQAESPLVSTTGQLMMIMEQELAKFCARHNAGFDKAKFLQAAGAK